MYADVEEKDHDNKRENKMKIEILWGMRVVKKFVEKSKNDLSILHENFKRVNESIIKK